MDEKEISALIRKKSDELSDLTHDAAVMGLRVFIRTQQEQEIGIPGEFVVVTAQILKVEEL